MLQKILALLHPRRVSSVINVVKEANPDDISPLSPDLSVKTTILYLTINILLQGFHRLGMKDNYLDGTYSLSMILLRSSADG